MNNEIAFKMLAKALEHPIGDRPRLLVAVIAEWLYDPQAFKKKWGNYWEIYEKEI